MLGDLTGIELAKLGTLNSEHHTSHHSSSSDDQGDDDAGGRVFKGVAHLVAERQMLPPGQRLGSGAAGAPAPLISPPP